VVGQSGSVMPSYETVAFDDFFRFVSISICFLRDY